MESDYLQKGSKPPSLLKRLNNFHFDEFLFKYRWSLTLLLIGLILIGLGVFIAKDSVNLSSTEVEVLDSNTSSLEEVSEIVVEVSGAVESPGVFSFPSGARIENALIASGGISANADRIWIEKYLNRAAKIIDGQKIYIPRIDEQSDVLNAKEKGVYQNASSTQESSFENLINVNTATQKELESLWGIGPVYAQNIIEHRPYSNVEELLSKGIIKTNVYERNKEYLTIY